MEKRGKQKKRKGWGEKKKKDEKGKEGEKKRRH